ncbi:protein of unknown function [Taphrina deformans PYCC 5710]|uniref:Coiled-coil domain-containing protein 12 n=1 Tax=Taphrina deformans (strain PYCC 5710 / ATCC 11124 / CBS 356.35 / IMI 108563 / JCM 9778 / NBRC 8474) TaxID=1097556 RepID=R4XGH6_TAPDE|nr:protein of unknown function [Taphrina deformans PYCC 5710]|eukprot:CCG84872.1 protein of unknown function [Taphrina deformans PYCC 5710]
MSLENQSQKRKERLALLSSNKRKRDDDLTEELAKEKEDVESKMKFRNYDPETNAPKLGFIDTPVPAEQETVETRAKELVEKTRTEDLTAREASDPLDLFTLQTRKPNWDLKRDLNRKLERLKSKQDTVVARLIRERIHASKHGDGHNIGGHHELDSGPNLALQVQQRERQMLQVTRSEV